MKREDVKNTDTGSERSTSSRDQVNTEGPTEPAGLMGGSVDPSSRRVVDAHPPQVIMPEPQLPRVESTPKAFDERGTNERTMWLINDTDVFDRPSYAAPAVGSLRKGDRIRVDARIGDWLRIRNRDEKPGFILLQDASEQAP